MKFPLYSEQGAPTGLCGIATDITELKKAQDQLRRLSGSIMANQEKERKAIARELHDELGQVLTALRMDAVWLSDRLQAPDPKAGDRALAMCGLIDHTIDEVRGLATRLRPGVLDDLGLIDALDWYIADFEKRTGIACIFKHRQVPDSRRHRGHGRLPHRPGGVNQRHPARRGHPGEGEPRTETGPADPGRGGQWPGLRP